MEPCGHPQLFVPASPQRGPRCAHLHEIAGVQVQVRGQGAHSRHCKREEALGHRAHTPPAPGGCPGPGTERGREPEGRQRAAPSCARQPLGPPPPGRASGGAGGRPATHGAPRPGRRASTRPRRRRRGRRGRCPWSCRRRRPPWRRRARGRRCRKAAALCGRGRGGARSPW